MINPKFIDSYIMKGKFATIISIREILMNQFKLYDSAIRIFDEAI